ncbi:1,4-dihydroxy-2-naphthoyl-CoA synthase, peroxisomal [Arachis hypogaea]|nr:1,4-dihydroxy-2-naphthoyl-CoA synthase, peroxisomal [Arachis hypogaea]
MAARISGKQTEARHCLTAKSNDFEDSLTDGSRSNLLEVNVSEVDHHERQVEEAQQKGLSLTDGDKSTTLVPLLNLITLLFIPTTNSNLAFDSSTSRNDSYKRVYGDVLSHDVVWRVIASDADSDKEFTDIIYEKAVGEGIAKISINRPERRNAFRHNTVKELICAFNDAMHDSSIGVVILTGMGTKAFCSGGDQALRIADGYSDNEDIGSLNALDLQNHPAVVVPRLPAGLNLPSPD